MGQPRENDLLWKYLLCCSALWDLWHGSLKIQEFWITAVVRGSRGQKEAGQGKGANKQLSVWTQKKKMAPGHPGHHQESPQNAAFLGGKTAWPCRPESDWLVWSWDQVCGSAVVKTLIQTLTLPFEDAAHLPPIMSRTWKKQKKNNLSLLTLTRGICIWEIRWKKTVPLSSLQGLKFRTEEVSASLWNRNQNEEFLTPCPAFIFASLFTEPGKSFQS